MSIFNQRLLAWSLGIYFVVSVPAISHAISGIRFFSENCTTLEPGDFGYGGKLKPEFCYKFYGLPVWSESKRELKNYQVMNQYAVEYCQDRNEGAYAVYGSTDQLSWGSVPLKTTFERGYVCLSDEDGKIAEQNRAASKVTLDSN